MRVIKRNESEQDFCIDKIEKYEQISDWLAEQLIYGFGLKLVKWPY